MIPSRAPETPGPLVPVGIVAKRVAIKSGLTEIVETFEILRCELVVRELVVSELIVAKLIVATIVFPIVTGSPPSITSHCMVVTEIMRGVLMTATDHGVASKRRMRVRPAVSAQGMATPPTTYGGHATVRSKSMKCSSAPAAMPAASAPTAMPAASATTPMPAATTPHRHVRRLQRRPSQCKARPPQRLSPECLSFSSSSHVSAGSSEAIGLAARRQPRGASPFPKFSYCGGVTRSWLVTYV
jgi:hypothetical protein